MRRRILTSLALLALATLGLGADTCGSSSDAADAGTCPDAAACTFIDPKCTTPTPSYSATVHELLVTTCVNCHYPDSKLAQSSLTTYEDVHLVFGAALDQVSNCLMPPQGYCPLNDEQRTELLTWLACGAPEN